MAAAHTRGQTCRPACQHLGHHNVLLLAGTELQVFGVDNMPLLCRYALCHQKVKTACWLTPAT